MDSIVGVNSLEKYFKIKVYLMQIDNAMEGITWDPGL